MEEQFSHQCDLVNQMKVYKRWVFATLKKDEELRLGERKKALRKVFLVTDMA